MNMKPLAMLAITSCVLSIAYVAPAMADETPARAAAPMPTATTPAQSMQTPATTDTVMQTASNENGAPAPGEANNAVANPADDGTPDTATGDDDY